MRFDLNPAIVSLSLLAWNTRNMALHLLRCFVFDLISDFIFSTILRLRVHSTDYPQERFLASLTSSTV